MNHYLPLVARVVDQADRRVLKGQTVSPDQKLYSLFEEHTELIVRGKVGKPIEFRAGSEGSISVLKQAFKLGKCFFKGFKNYAASVGFAVFCHNLVLLTRL